MTEGKPHEEGSSGSACAADAPASEYIDTGSTPPPSAMGPRGRSNDATQQANVAADPSSDRGGQASTEVHAGADTSFTFGPYTYLPHRQVLLHGRSPVRVGPRALDVLRILLLRAGDLVTKEELIGSVWPHVFVDEGNLKVHVRSLRRAFRESRRQPNYIATIPGRGYRFISPVSVDSLVGRTFSYNDAAPTAGALPPHTDPIGREDEVREIGQALDEERLVTLVGPGGVGKTTLAAHVAQTKLGCFPDGVYFVDLSTTNDASLVPHLVATTLGLRGGPTDVTSSVVEYLGERRMLLLLDNCEHVVKGVNLFGTRLVEAAVSATLLATSREPIGCAGEVTFRIRPLAHPGNEAVHDVGRAMSFPSVQLFALRASEQTGHSLAEDEIPTVARLCALMDGIPLAIEILASKVDGQRRLSLSPGEEGTFLQSFADACQAEENPLWAAFQWSYRLLSPAEALTYRILSVFSSRFEPADVAVLSEVAGLDPHQSTVSLGRLVAQSLVTAEMDAGTIRYGLLECSRRYAAQRLSQDASLARSMHLCHARHVLSGLRRAEDDWHWTETSAWRARNEQRLGDVRQALDWCFGPDGDATLGVSLAAAAIRVWNTQSSVFEQMRHVERALEHARHASNRTEDVVRLAVSRAWSLTLARQLGPGTDEAWRVATELSERCTDPGVHASTLSSSSTYLVYTGRSALALDRLRRGLAGVSSQGSRASVIEYERRIAFAEMHLGLLVPARDRAEALAREFENGTAPSLIVRYKEEPLLGIKSVLALTTWLTGNPERATTMVDDLVERTGHARQAMGQSHVLALYALPMAAWQGNDASLRRVTAELRLNLEAISLGIWDPVCRFFEALSHRHLEESLGMMRLAIDDLIQDRMLVRTPLYLGLLAEAERSHGLVDAAARSIERALNQEWQIGERWCLPELLRIKACVSADAHDDAQARTLRDRALATARTMDARFFERRILDDIAGTGSSTIRQSEPSASPVQSPAQGAQRRPPRRDGSQGARGEDDHPRSTRAHRG